jgi:guanylate kinase
LDQPDGRSSFLIFVLFGPGGAGKGTVADHLVDQVPDLWLSRSWTTRARRSGEREDAYVFVDRATFQANADADGFFEWAEYLGNLYGTPVPAPPAGADVLLEIDLQGAQQVRHRCPGATLILLKPPSAAVQEERLRARGDDEAHIAKRLAEGAEEVRIGMTIADAVVTNLDVPQATARVAGIVESCRSAASQGGGSSRGPTGAPAEPLTPPPDQREGS